MAVLRNKPRPKKEPRAKSAKERTPEDGAALRLRENMERARYDLAKAGYQRAAVCAACGSIREDKPGWKPCDLHPFSPHLFITV